MTRLACNSLTPYRGSSLSNQLNHAQHDSMNRRRKKCGMVVELFNPLHRQLHGPVQPAKQSINNEINTVSSAIDSKVTLLYYLRMISSMVVRYKLDRKLTFSSFSAISRSFLNSLRW